MLHTAEQQLLAAFTEELTRFETPDIDISGAEAAIDVCYRYLSQLKTLVQQYGFADKDEEIAFFKHRKPLYLSQILYYKAIYDFYSHRPGGTETMKREYIEHELSRLTQFYTEHHSFHVYCTTGSTYLDEKYFLRGPFDVRLLRDNFRFEADDSFSTGYDFLVSQIMANKQFLTFIDELLIQSESRTSISSSSHSSNTPSVTWTGSKTDLVELMYALHTAGVINNGKADLKLIATFLQQAFHIDLGNYYDLFQNIRMRKTGQTKFLDYMKAMLTKKIDDME